MCRALYIIFESFFVKKVQMDIYLANFKWEPLVIRIREAGSISTHPSKKGRGTAKRRVWNPLRGF